MIETSTLSPNDLDLVVQFASHMRDLDTATRFCRATWTDSPRIGPSFAIKANVAVNRKLDPHIAASFKVLTKLEQSASLELRILAERSINRDMEALKELRRIGNKVSKK
jgi:hypothetical protein